MITFICNLILLFIGTWLLHFDLGWNTAVGISALFAYLKP